MSTSKKRLFELILTAALIIGSVGLSQNSKVVEAADEAILLEKRHPGYWEWLRANAIEVDTDQDGEHDATIFPVSKMYKNEVTTDDYQIFLKDADRDDNHRVIYFFDGTGFDVDKNIYGAVDTDSWIVNGEASDWNSIYYEEKPLNEVTDIYEYLRKLKDYSFIISIKDDAFSGWNEDLTASLKELGLEGGFTYRESYIAVVENGEIKNEQVGHDPLEYSDGTISVTSAGMEAGNYSSILVNGNEYSKQGRGLNIVVLKDGEVIDSVNFDTWSWLYPCTR